MSLCGYIGMQILIGFFLEFAETLISKEYFQRQKKVKGSSNTVGKFRKLPLILCVKSENDEDFTPWNA